MQTVTRGACSACILQGDTREAMRRLPADSVHCVVTSPPYFGLRDYGVAGQIGLEASLAEYVAALVDVFREVRRVLRPDGVAWLNLGDSFATAGGPGTQGAYGARADRRHTATGSSAKGAPDGTKPKDLLMVPARVALALQADGWYLRSQVIWHKPNPMPESVTDRPTSAHESVFLLTRSQRYFYDAEAVKEPLTESSVARLTQPGFHAQKGGPKDPGTGNRSARRGVENLRAALDAGRSGRNLRNVWTIAPRPYSGAHFATMPVDLAARCIAAGSSAAGCCSDCGAPWRRMAGAPERAEGRGSGNAARRTGADRDRPDSTLGASVPWVPTTRQTIAWQPTCDCPPGALLTPCVVLDPFGGAGTTALAALTLGRSAVLAELNPDYIALAAERLRTAPIDPAAQTADALAALLS